MNVKVENLEHSMARLTIEVEAEQLEKAINTAYNKQKKNISVPGFRKGKVPRAMVEKMYGPEVFYEEAADILLQETYPQAYDESGLEITSQPTVNVEQLEKGKPFIYTADVAVKPEVTLGKYKGVSVDKVDVTVSDEDIDAEISKELENSARTISVERPIADGDTAVIDFEGFVDGVAFEGGKGEDYNLVIGSHSFIDTFEEQLIGKSAGDEIDVNVTFPEQYQAEELAGKPALFKVKINDVMAKEIPELDDDFAQDVSEFDTVEEYKESIKAKLADEKEKAAKAAKQQQAIDAIIEDSTMDIAGAMVDTQVNRMLNEFAQSMAQQGLSMEQYMQFTGGTVDSLKEQARPDAIKRIQTSLVLEAVAKAEGLEATEEELQAKIEEMAKMYGMELEKIQEYVTDDEKKAMKDDIAVQKAVDFIYDNVKEKAAKKAKKTEE